MKAGYQIDQYGIMDRPTLIALYNFHSLNQVDIACYIDYKVSDLIARDKLTAVFKVKYKTSNY